MKAALEQTEKQLKSAGGISVLLSFNHSSIESDSSLIPTPQYDNYLGIDKLQKGNVWGVNISPGYAYTFVRGDFYIATLFNLGIGFQLQSYTKDSNKDWYLRLSPDYKFQQVIGYNSNDGFVRLAFNFESSNFRASRTSFRYNYVAISLGGGIRIK
jgi:hypothetical protein